MLNHSEFDIEGVLRERLRSAMSQHVIPPVTAQRVELCRREGLELVSAKWGLVTVSVGLAVAIVLVLVLL